jgi:hypothetical protein
MNTLTAKERSRIMKELRAKEEFEKIQKAMIE